MKATWATVIWAHDEPDELTESSSSPRAANPQVRSVSNQAVHP